MRRKRRKPKSDSYILNYTVSNVSKRTGETRDDVRKWLKRVAKGQKTCPFCQAAIPLGKFAVDHKQAIFRGGSLRLANCHLTCQPCNRAKGDLNVDEFHALLAFLNAQDGAMKKSVLARLKIAGALYRGK